MSLVDWGKAARRRVTDVLCPQRIVFHHVAKCGGTSIGRALRRAYFVSQGTITPEESFRAVAAFTGRADRESVAGHLHEFREMMLLYLLYSDIRCVAAHVPFSDIAYEVFHGKFLFVTLLRDPVERFVSHYLWSYKRANAFGSINEGLGDFLMTDRAKTLGAVYALYFCGRPRITFADMSRAVKLAESNLRRLDHVGFLDDMVRFQAMLRHLTGKRLTIGRENVGTRRSMHASIIEGHLRQRLFDLCAPDREIWDAVQDLRGKHPSTAAPHRPAFTNDLLTMPARPLGANGGTEDETVV